MYFGLPSSCRVSSGSPRQALPLERGLASTKVQRNHERSNMIQHGRVWKPCRERYGLWSWLIHLDIVGSYIYVCVISDVYSFTFLIYVKAVEESKSAHPSGDYFRASFVEPGQSTISKTARLKKVGNSHGWLKKGRIKDVGNLPSFTEITIINAYIILYIYDWHRLQPWITIGWFLFFTVDKSTSPDSDAIQAAVLWN